jgi:hypothetical protein
MLHQNRRADHECIRQTVFHATEKTATMETFEPLREIIKHQLDNCASSEAALATLGSPSTSIGTLDDEEISSHCIATEGHNQDTLFQACSISKPVACVSAAILVQQGKLSFDDKIVALLPLSVMEVLETPSTKHLLGEITIRMLMSHTLDCPSMRSRATLAIYHRLWMYSLVKVRSTPNTCI